MRPALPPVAFTLAPWSDDVVTAWARHEARAQRLAAGAGTGRHFERVVAEARALLEAGDEAAVAARLGERRFARATVTVWAEDRELARSTMTPHLLAMLRRPGVPVTRHTAIALTRLLLTHFDLVDLWRPGLFDELSVTTAAAAAAQPQRASDVVETLRSEGSYVLHRQGPSTLARHLLTTDTDATHWLRQHHLGDGERFHRVVADAVHLTRIALADATRPDNGFLREVTHPTTVRLTNEADPRSGRMFGHDVLEALTAKQTSRPHDTWIDAILRIGGDPRLQGTQQWELWWGRVDRRALDQALRWVSGVDLRAFLDGIARYAHDTGNDDMVRMLERRARLLNGLYEQGLVQDVRLILGSAIRAAIRRAAPLSLVDAPDLDDTGKADTAVIYVDCGQFALVEGSHNFQLYLYTRKPVPELANRRTRAFTGAQLRYDIPDAHGSVASFRHDAHGAWVRSALDRLRSEGIRLDERGLVSPGDYVALLNRRARDGY